MANKEVMIIANYNDNTALTVDEICEICHVPRTVVEDLIQYEIIHPLINQPNQYAFDIAQLQRLRKALRLQHDLEINLAGIAVMLNLLDELEEMRQHMQFLKRHF